MSVVGIDIGNFKTSIGIAKQGGIEIIANEFSDRITPTYVAFTNRERFQGHAAKQQEITNSQNTLSCFKRLLGRKLSDPQVQHETSFQKFRFAENPHDKILLNVDYQNELKSLTSEQVLAVFLTKVKSIADMNLHTKIVDCVLSVPAFFTDAERRALLDATQIVGLNCLKLMNEPTAVALNYGLYHSNLPETTEKPHIAALIDMGYTQTQVSLVAFNKGKLRVLATAFDSNLGGRDFDKVLMDYFQQDFLKNFKVDAYTNNRARLRLRTECEKVKKMMSSISSPIPLSIECFMNDKDVSGKIKRDDFEQLSVNLFARFKSVLIDCLTQSKLKLEEIDVVEIVGGSTRIPAAKALIQEVFGKEASTTLNADEAVARGCTLMCAILSPTFKVREFKIEDCQLFPITLNWKGTETEDNELEIFPQGDKIPMAKMLTIYKKEAFEIEARYRYPNNIPFGEARIGKFNILNVKPNASGENSEIKVKARVNKFGIFEISSPQMIEVVELAPQEETMDVEAPKESESKENGVNENGDETTQQGDDAKEAADGQKGDDKPAEGGEGQAQAVPTKKRKTKALDLALEAKVPAMNKNEINFYVEQELSMIQQDRKEKERSEAKNSVEEYIYEMRDKLSSDFEKFVLPDVKERFLKALEEAENWLYEDGIDDLEKSVFVERLNKLKEFGEPIRRRHKEHDERNATIDDFGKSLQQISKAVDLYYSNDEKYAHIEKSEIEKVAKTIDDKRKSFDEKTSALRVMKPYEDPVILNSQIKFEREQMEKTSWAILNRPKPKVDKPKEQPPNATPEQQQEQKGAEQQQQPKAADMDVD